MFLALLFITNLLFACLMNSLFLQYVDIVLLKTKKAALELAKSEVQGTQPVFEKKLLSATATEGETVKLTCNASGLKI